MARLERKLAEWTDAGLMTPEQAAAIRAHEAAPKPGLPWGILIFAGFGAVVLGLGIILLFAYNWDKMHRFAKLGVVFASLAIAHGVGLSLRRREKLHGFAESALLLGTMLFGSGIWLVAQAYHISSHYPNAFFVWAAGALMLAWVVPSIAQGLVAAALLTIWGCTEAASFNTHLTAAPLLILVGTGWLAWRLRSPVLLAASVVSFAISAATGFAFAGDCVFPILLGTAVLLVALAWLTREHPAFPTAHPVFTVTGGALYLVLLFILTFHDAAEELMGKHLHSLLSRELSITEWLPVVIFPAVALAVAFYAVQRAIARHEAGTPEFRERLGGPAALLLLFLALWWPLRAGLGGLAADSAGATMAAAANVFFLYYTVANLWCGCRDTRLNRVVFGSLLLAAWVFARFADLFDSLLARGVMFVAMGVALFVVAVLYHRQKQRGSGGAPPVPEAANSATVVNGKEG